MEKVGFIQKTIALVQSSQYLIENLWEIETEVSKLLEPLTSFFSSFSGIFIKIIVYQSNIHRFVQQFTLTRFELLFPYYLSEERIIQKRGEHFHVQTEKLAVPFLLNLSIIKEVSNVVAKIAKETSDVTLPKPQETEIKVIEKYLEKSPKKTIVRYIGEVQNQLWSKITTSIMILSPTLLEYKRLTVPLHSLAANYKSALFDQTDFVYPISYPVYATSQEEKAKPSFPERSSKESIQEPLLGKSMKSEKAPSDLTIDLTLGPETLRAIDYATNLPKNISDKLTPFLRISTLIPQISPVEMPVSPSIEPADNYATNIPRIPTITPPSQISFLPKKADKSLNSWMHEIVETLRDTQVNLSALPVAASKLKRLLAETPIPSTVSIEKKRIHGDYKLYSQELPSTEIKSDVSYAPVEAYRFPSILTSIINNLTKMPFNEPLINFFTETASEVEPAAQQRPTSSSDSSQRKELYKVPLKLALAATEKIVTQRFQQASKTFMKEIQIARSTYTRAVAELGLVGPVRTTLLGELSSGLSIPTTIETIAPDETTFPYAGDINPPFQEQAITPLPIEQNYQTQSSININVITDTAEQDTRDLERKISRILLDQVAELGLVGPVRTTLLGELSSGLSIPTTIEPTMPNLFADSQKLQSQSKMSTTSQETINFNVFANTVEEDLRELERKIHNILSEQISRYYGSSKI